MNALVVPEMCRAPRLVERDPVRNSISQSGECGFGVVRESPGRIRIRPAARIFQSLRQIPVIQCRHRRDSGLQKSIDQAGIKLEALLVERTGAVWKQPRPGDRESVALKA